jgi:hypothetical protein
MKLPRMRMIAVPESQRLNSARWLQEWQIEQQLLSSGSGDDIVFEHIPDADDVPRQAFVWPKPAEPSESLAPAPGQIRLLSPEIRPDDLRPVYAAVISDWDEGLLLVAPFSEFKSPATRGEFLTGRPEPPLSVLCSGFAVSVSMTVLSRSWHVDEMDEALTKAAWQVFWHAATGDKLPTELQSRVGAPIVHPFDPRIAYQRRLSALMAPLLRQTAAELDAAGGADDEASFQENIKLPWLAEGFGVQPSNALAADSGKADAVSGKSLFSLENVPGVTLRVSRDKDSLHCSFVAVRDDGSLSGALDGAVVTAGIHESKPFVRGRTNVSCDWIKNGFSIRLADGAILRFVREDMEP